MLFHIIQLEREQASAFFYIPIPNATSFVCWWWKKGTLFLPCRVQHLASPPSHYQLFIQCSDARDTKKSYKRNTFLLLRWEWKKRLFFLHLMIWINPRRGSSVWADPASKWFIVHKANLGELKMQLWSGTADVTVSHFQLISNQLHNLTTLLASRIDGWVSPWNKKNRVSHLFLGFLVRVVARIPALQWFQSSVGFLFDHSVTVSVTVTIKDSVTVTVTHDKDPEWQMTHDPTATSKPRASSRVKLVQFHSTGHHHDHKGLSLRTGPLLSCLA